MTDTRRILLAEDNITDAELALAALARHGFDRLVDVVRDGAEALDYLRHNPPPAVLLLDVKMPRVGGLDVLRAINGDPELRTIPAIMLSSSGERADLRAAYECGVNGYVVKPVDFLQLSESLCQTARFWTTVNEPPPAPQPAP